MQGLAGSWLTLWHWQICHRSVGISVSIVSTAAVKTPHLRARDLPYRMLASFDCP